MAGESDLIRRDLRLARDKWMRAVLDEDHEAEFVLMAQLDRLLDRFHKARCMVTRDAGSLSGQ